MGTNKFQEDYIAYLEECNANLQEKLVKIREFQNRIISDRVQNRHYETTLREVTNICNSTCEAIDNLFENFTATMNSLKIVLLWKSQISQLPDKISCAMRSGYTGSTNQISASSHSVSGTSSPVDKIPESKNIKKCGTAKVSPMIDGHVISTPTIHLNRVSEGFGQQANRSLGTTLSPIIETSPSTSPQNDQKPTFREARITLQRLQLDNIRGKTYISEGCQKENKPKINTMSEDNNGFKFRKPYDSLKGRYQYRLMKRKVGEAHKVKEGLDEEIEEREGTNDNAPNSNAEPEENIDAQGRNSSEEVDPLEGPSWLLDKPQRSERSSGLSSFRYNFINFKRPNYNSFNRSANADDMRREILNFNENAQMGNFESNVNEEEVRTITLSLNKLTDANKLPEENDGSLYEDSNSNSIKEKESEDSSKSDSSDCMESRTGSLKCSLESRKSLTRKSIGRGRPSMSSPKATVRSKENFRPSYVDAALNKSRTSLITVASKNSPVNVNGESCLSTMSHESNSPKKSKIESSSSPSVPSRNTPRNEDARGEKNLRKSNGRISRIENPIRVKRRAAEICSQRMHSLEIQSRQGTKSKKRSREKKKKSKVKY